MNWFTHFLSLLSNADSSLLLFFNGFHTRFLDELMWTISDRWCWLPLYLLFATLIFHKYRVSGGLVCILMIGVMIATTDQVCASVIRPLCCRLRPSYPENTLSDMLHYVNDYRGGKFGFPSCHAANTFALAMFLSRLMKNKYFTFGAIFWSMIVSYSRLYLGVHYPSDILGGYAVGAIVSIISFKITKFLLFKIPAKSASTFVAVFKRLLS